jgi:hypothetical protein
MTSNTGKRAALVTIENTASGHRSIESTQVMALFADGYRTDAKQVSYKDNLKANESRTFTLNFGEYEYPIIAVYATQNLD